LDDYQHLFGIDRNRCEIIYDAGFTDMEKLKLATVLELKAVPGINPTIARLIKDKLSSQDAEHL
jgi:hypothetical protein